MAQEQPDPIAAFYFNNGDIRDELNGHSAELQDANFTEDRFGNKANAVYLSGNGESCINLGSYKELKPVSGSISFWIKMEHPIQAGKGVLINPILITHNDTAQDFNEAFAFYYMLESHKFLVAFTRDSLKEVGVYSSEEFQRQVWKHIVATYDSNQVSLYIDGALQATRKKTFQTRFFPDLPVLVGFNGSRKNTRWWNGSIDDIMFFDTVLTQAQVEALYHAPNPNKNAILLQRILIGLGIAGFVASIFLFIRYRVRLALKREKEKNEVAHTLLQTELRVNRALMNPHFVFNSLNALQNLILNNEVDKANDYLVKFSKMIRKLLESNMSDTITLALEVEVLTRYMEIESLRFNEKIDFSIDVSADIHPHDTRIPVMMLQPFVENAIWHGLLRKQGEKRLNVSFSLVEQKYVLCCIEDNGIGKQSAKNSAIFDKASLATSFIEQRLRTLNLIYQLKCDLTIEYKPNQSGTILKILLPILNT